MKYFQKFSPECRFKKGLVFKEEVLTNFDLDNE